MYSKHSAQLLCKWTAAHISSRHNKQYPDRRMSVFTSMNCDWAASPLLTLNAPLPLSANVTGPPALHQTVPVLSLCFWVSPLSLLLFFQWLFCRLFVFISMASLSLSSCSLSLLFPLAGCGGVSSPLSVHCLRQVSATIPATVLRREPVPLLIGGVETITPDRSQGQQSCHAGLQTPELPAPPWKIRKQAEVLIEGFSENCLWNYWHSHAIVHFSSLLLKLMFFGLLAKLFLTGCIWNALRYCREWF